MYIMYLRSRKQENAHASARAGDMDRKFMKAVLLRGGCKRAG